MDISRIETDTGWRTDNAKSEPYRGKHYSTRVLEITGDLSSYDKLHLERWLDMTRPIGQSFRMIEYVYTPTGISIKYQVYCDSGD